jgi:hypothetical protein
MLLMGAMVVASMSMFTSCKDYDDDINKNANDIKALQTQLATLQTALTTAQGAAATAQSAADAAAAAAKAAQSSADANATSIKAAQDAVKAIEAQVAAAAKVTDLEAAKKELEKAIEDATAGKVSAEELLEALKPISAKIDAIDESLNTLATDVDALKTWKASVDGKIAAVEADLKSQSDAIKALQEEIKKKIEAGDLEIIVNEKAVKAYVDEQLKAYAKSADVAELLKSYTTTAELNKILEGYSTPASVNAAIIEALKSYYTAAKIDEMVVELNNAIKKAQETADAAQTEEQVKAIAQAIADEVSAEAGEKINVLNVLVNKILTSVTLIPQLYLNGIEAIQFVSVQYIPQVKDYTIVPNRYNDATMASGYWITNGTTPEWQTLGHHQLVDKAGAQAIRIDNGETEAYYRLSPAGVNADDLDLDNIKFSCTTADTKTRAPELKDNDPVKATYSSLENGVMTVKLNKTVTGSLNYDGENNTKDVIASLMVPRKAIAEKNQEYAEIYSEFNLIDEITISPRIAALNKVKAGEYVFNGTTATTKHDKAIAMQYHFIDSAKIWKSQVDKNVWVKEEIQYDEEFDLTQLVTGCYETAAGTHTEITKEALAKYGLEFRFYIPSKEYGDADLVNYNFTNQQVFAKISGEKSNIISATLPSGASALGNRAIIGKEPIVRVELIDVERNNLLDMAYFKVKFVDNSPKKEAIKVTEEFEAQTLGCVDNDMYLTWDKFIEDVYAKMEGTYGTGLSWQEFRQVYPSAKVQRNDKPFTLYGTSVDGSSNEYIIQANDPDDDNQLGDIKIWWLSAVATTESPSADANKLLWSLNPEDIKTIDLTTREKEIETKVIFVSNRPTDYGNIELTLKAKIKLPQTALTYYENYWYDKYNSHYVLPVQYNTAAYKNQLVGKKANNLKYDPTKIRAAYTDEDGAAGAYCVYNNNLFNAFTFNQTATVGTPAVANRWYKTLINGLEDFQCGKFDYQFRIDQTATGTTAAPFYKAIDDDAEEPLKTEGITGKYTQTAVYASPAGSVSQINGGAEFGAYALQTKIGTEIYKDAISMTWYDDNTVPAGTALSAQNSWNWKAGDAPYLFVDHFNANNQILINPITSNGIGKAPTFSNDKKITMGVWFKYNAWNYELIKTYTICLVAPLDINAELKGHFEEGLVSGSDINCADAFTMVDFRGYEVKNAAPAATAGEFQKYADRLYKYYECADPTFDLTKVKYGMKYENGNVVVDNEVTLDNISSKGLTSAQIDAYTNGNVVLSITQPDANTLRFKNNGGSNVEDVVNVFIPATMDYGFGKITKYVKVVLYPRGQVPAAARNK